MLRGSAGGRGDPRGLGGRDHSDSIQDCSSCCGFYLFSFFVLFRFECLFIVNNLIFNFLKKNGQVGWLPVSLVLQWNQHVFIYLFIDTVVELVIFCLSTDDKASARSRLFNFFCSRSLSIYPCHVSSKRHQSAVRTSLWAGDLTSEQSLDVVTIGSRVSTLTV